MFILLSIAQCFTFGEENIELFGEIYSKTGEFFVKNINIQRITVDDNAAICISKEEYSTKISTCDFSYITSNSGACCLLLLLKIIEVRNICSSYLFPQYQDVSHKGGCSLSINSSTQTNIDCVSVSNVLHKQKNVYATLWFNDCSETMRNTNQTKCTCMPVVNFACGFVYHYTKSNDMFIIMSNSSGDYVNDYLGHKEGSVAEKMVFNFCTSTRGFISFHDSDISLTMNDCIIKNCEGPILYCLSGTLVLNGWYSDKDLPSSFINTKTTEFEISISSAICKIPKEQNQLTCSVRVCTITSFLIAQFYKNQCI